jgi:DNA-binding HxlR family transcriptional regulator
LERIIYAEIPPRVEYKLTAYGLSLMPLIGVIEDWGAKDLKKNLEAKECPLG